MFTALVDRGPHGVHSGTEGAQLEEADERLGNVVELNGDARVVIRSPVTTDALTELLGGWRNVTGVRDIKSVVVRGAGAEVGAARLSRPSVPGTQRGVEMSDSAVGTEPLLLRIGHLVERRGILKQRQKRRLGASSKFIGFAVTALAHTFKETYIENSEYQQKDRVD